MKYLQHLGKPWVCGSQGPQTFDCWGLLKTVYRESFGIELDPLEARRADQVADCVRVAAGIVESPDWTETKEPREGDAVALSRRSAIHHVGIYLKGRRVLHAVSSNGVIVQSIHSLKLNGFSIIKFYHHELCPNC
jgi:cell wall-associated NlpC family hydrolase